MLPLIVKSLFAVSVSGTPIAEQPALERARALPEPVRAQAGNSFNPQISIVGDFAGVLRDTGNSEPKRFDFREVEFGFAADADPFLKVEAYIAVAREDGETEVEVEEVFGRYNNLGRGISAKFGKIAAAVGRVQRNHADQLGYMDYPLVIRDVLGEEGLRQPGASFSYLFPGSRFSELTLEALDAGDEGPIFNGSSLDNPVYVAHYRTFFDFDQDTSGALGVSYLNGPSSAASGRGHVAGIDYTMKWQPGQTGRSAYFEGEAFWTKPPGYGGTSFGAFGRVVYEFQPRWFATLGCDYSEIPGTSDRHHGWLAGVTVKPTEFHHWRIEGQRLRHSSEGTQNLLRIQFQWVIGAHPAHRY